MPGRDGTCPKGMRAMTGRGMGFCNPSKAAGTIGRLGLGLGLGCRRGFSRYIFDNAINPKNQKDLLMQEKIILENRLNQI